MPTKMIFVGFLTCKTCQQQCIYGDLQVLCMSLVFQGFTVFSFFCGDHLSYFTLNLIWKKTLVGEWTIDVELLLAMPVVEWMQQ